MVTVNETKKRDNKAWDPCHAMAAIDADQSGWPTLVTRGYGIEVSRPGLACGHWRGGSTHTLYRAACPEDSQWLQGAPIRPGWCLFGVVHRTRLRPLHLLLLPGMQLKLVLPLYKHMLLLVEVQLLLVVVLLLVVLRWVQAGDRVALLTAGRRRGRPEARRQQRGRRAPRVCCWRLPGCRV